MPSFGLPAEGRRRWCGGCAKTHAGARDITSRLCEDCALRRPSLKLPSDKRARWCGGCAKAHAGAQNLNPRRQGPPRRRKKTAATDFTEASLVWAKCGTYPWWPAEARFPLALAPTAALELSPLPRPCPGTLLQRQLAAWPAN